mmetsp:Transcript_44912/g.111556  ORF Transcript_44912/g.111556 Transcript_44912/m.111556 type:complete len:290 (-) Transcript_44912:203-1072(-)
MSVPTPHTTVSQHSDPSIQSLAHLAIYSMPPKIYDPTVKNAALSISLPSLQHLHLHRHLSCIHNPPPEVPGLARPAPLPLLFRPVALRPPHHDQSRHPRRYLAGQVGLQVAHVVQNRLGLFKDIVGQPLWLRRWGGEECERFVDHVVAVVGEGLVAVQAEPRGQLTLQVVLEDTLVDCGGAHVVHVRRSHPKGALRMLDILGLYVCREPVLPPVDHQPRVPYGLDVLPHEHGDDRGCTLTDVVHTHTDSRPCHRIIAIAGAGQCARRLQNGCRTALPGRADDSVGSWSL